MIAAWMLTASAFALCAALAALSAEQAARALGRPARWGWIAALAASVVWPVVALLMRREAPVALMPPIRVTQLVSPARAVGGGWLPALDHAMLAMWVLLSVVLLVRVVQGLRRVGAMRRCADRQDVSGLSVLVSDAVGPAVVGLVRPEIVFPRALLALDPALRDVIVRHEEEHRRAGDAWLAFGATMAVTLMPWNVALWWIARRARLALEIDCDARVLGGQGDPVQYGKLLLLVAQGGSGGRLVPALVSSRTHLERRIRAMLNQHPTHRGIRVMLGTIGLVVASVAAASAHVTGAPEARAGVRAARDTGETARRDSGKGFFEFTVDQPAKIIDGSYFMKYPDALKADPKAGSALVQYVVTADGTMLPGSLKILKVSDPAFVPSIRDALAMARFTPAMVGGRAVRQLVEEPMEFPLPPRP